MPNHSGIINKAIDEAVGTFNLPPSLLHALVKVESGGKLFAVRYEPGYRWLWDVRRNKPYRMQPRRAVCPAEFPYRSANGSRATEFMCQRTSWGPLQIMGAVAREYGFDGALAELCGPAGVHYGARHLARLRDRWFDRTGWDGVIAAYNAGSPRKDKSGRYVNQNYVDKVRRAGFR